jgi:hypothetical protein
MRTCFVLVSFLGTIPGLFLVLLTFLGFPQWAIFTEKLVGPEPEVVQYYVVSKVAGTRGSFEVVPRTLRSKLVPAIIIMVGICLQLLGLIWYFITRSE